MAATDDLLRRVERACRDRTSSRKLRDRLLDDVRTVLPFDGHVFALTDPVSKVGTSPHAHVPMLPWPRLPELLRWRYLTTVNRPDMTSDGPATSLLGSTASPDESLMWRHVQRELGVVDVAAVGFGDRFGAWGFLELWRTSAPFSAEELAVLTRLKPLVTPALRGSLAGTFADDQGDVRALGPAVVVLGPDLQVRQQTDAAGAALMQLLPPDEPMAPIPAAAYNVGAALIAKEQGVTADRALEPGSPRRSPVADRQGLAAGRGHRRLDRVVHARRTARPGHAHPRVVRA